MITLLAMQCKSGKSAVLALSTVHIVESPGNEATSGSFLLFIHVADLPAICSILYGQSLSILSILSSCMVFLGGKQCTDVGSVYISAISKSALWKLDFS